MSMPRLTVVVPTLNEGRNPLFPFILKRLSDLVRRAAPPSSPPVSAGRSHRLGTADHVFRSPSRPSDGITPRQNNIRDDVAAQQPNGLGVEVLCIDGGSTDHTHSLVKEFPLISLISRSPSYHSAATTGATSAAGLQSSPLYSSLSRNAPSSASEIPHLHVDLPLNNRAQRLNEGISRANGKFVLLHHPRSIVDLKGLEHLYSCSQHLSENAWGGFTHRFDDDHSFLDFTSWYSNHVRMKRRGIVYLDHCIFASSRLLKRCGMVPDLDIFEDTELSLNLLHSATPPSTTTSSSSPPPPSPRPPPPSSCLSSSSRLNMPIRLPFDSTTSSVRFHTNGLLKQGIMNQFLKVAYRLRVSKRWMNKLYERNAPFNCAYDDRPPDRRT